MSEIVDARNVPEEEIRKRILSNLTEIRDSTGNYSEMQYFYPAWVFDQWPEMKVGLRNK